MSGLHQIRNLFISDGMKKLVGWEYPIFGQAFLNLMERKKVTFGFRHHRLFDNFCHDGNPPLSRLDPGLSLHPC
jgi:hypothetical protein